jgi:NTE family protein
LWSQHKIGLALSGGGARGYAHIGVLKVIDESGLKPDYIAGTSFGSLIGALYAKGYSATELEEMALKGELNIITEDSIPRDQTHIMRKHWAPYGNISVPLNNYFLPEIPSGLTYGQHLQMQLYRLFYPDKDYASFDDLSIPFRCVATEFSTGKLTVFDSGALSEVCRASMNTPSILEPFYYKDQFFVDGGLIQNLPCQTVKEMGADFVIAIKVNSPLRPDPDNNNFVQNFDQALNIAITENVKNSIACSDLLIEPKLEGYTNLDFDKIREIIDLGEQEARKQIKLLTKLSETKENDPVTIRKTVSNPSRITIDNIRIKGNRGFTRLQIREFLQLQGKKTYGQNEIDSAFKKTFNTGLFEYIYPTYVVDDKSTLVVNLKEKPQKNLALNLSYNDYDNLSAGVVIELTNFIAKNSQLVTEVELGGRNEIQSDFIKNYGRYSGLYTRIFPYYNESRVYTYNEDFWKTNSYRAKEYGLTTGIGFYVEQLFIVEAFAYNYNFHLLRDVTPNEMNEETASSGLGFKIYQETLDNYSFPMSGSRFILKYNTAKKGALSDVNTKKVYSKLFFSDKILEQLSVNFTIEYGSYHQYSQTSQYQEFYIGGPESFPGYKVKQISAPIFKIFGLGMTWNFYKNLYLQNYTGAINYASSDNWNPWTDFNYGTSLNLGYSSMFGPVKLGVGINNQTKLDYFISVGYNFNIFEFAHR